MFKNNKEHDPYSALRIKEFRLFLYARFFLTIAIQMQGVIVGWQIYEATKDPLALGLIGLAEAIPFISVALFAGHVADKFDRKNIIVIFCSLLLLATISLFTFTFQSADVLSRVGVWPIYSIIVITGICRGFLGPSLVAFWSQIVPRETYTNASTWNSTVWQVGAVAGPAIGGLIYGYSGVNTAYLTDCVLILVSIFYFLFISKKPLPVTSIKESLKESLSSGIKFVFGNQIMLGAISLDLFAVFFGGAVALLPVFAAEVLHTGPEGLGILRSAPAIGAVIMALVLAFYPVDKNSGKKLIWSVGAFGVSMICFAISKNFYLSFFFLMFSGAVDNVSVVIRSTIMQLLTPDNMRGRVSAVNSIFIGSSNEIGALESGVAARLLGLIPSVIFGGSMTVLITGITAKVAPKLRKLELKELE